MMNNNSSRRKRRPTSKAGAGQRVTIGGISGLVIVVIVLVAQYGLGIDVGLDEEPDNPGSGNPAPVVEVPDVTVPENLIPIDGGYDGGWFQVYFTEPDYFSDGPYAGSPVEAAVVTAIDGAQSSVDAAIYELNSQPITDALIAAHERGVRVRVATDGEHGLEDPDTTMDQLEDVGIPVVSDEFRNDFMHNKFLVIDGSYVWTGSTNLTVNGLYRNNNNAILIRSSRLAQNYQAEFDELFAGEFGKTSPGDVPNPVVSIDGTQIETLFESEGYFPERLIELLRDADTARFMAFSFTSSFSIEDRSESIMDVLVEEHNAGSLDVQGVIEASQRSFMAPLVCAGLDIRQDGNPRILHHKVFVLDGEIVVMGSFNFSRSASVGNDENVLIIHHPGLAQVYLNEFARRWAEGSPITTGDVEC